MFQEYVDLYRFITNPIKFLKRDKDFVFKLNGKQIYCTKDKELIEKINAADLFDREMIIGVLGNNILTETQSKIDSLKLKKIFVKTLAKIELKFTPVFSLSETDGKQLIDFALFRLLGFVFSNGSQIFPNLYHNWITSITPDLLFSKTFRHNIFPSWRKLTTARKELEAWIKAQITFPDSFPNCFKQTALEEGIYLSDQEIINECLLFLFGSFDNVAILCANLFIRFNQEFRPDRIDDFLNDLDYHIIDVLRSKPPIPFIPKTLLKSFIYKDKVFFAGETIGVIPTATNDKMFGEGKRKCPGEKFTRQLVKLTLPQLLKQYKLVGKVKYGRQRFSWGPIKFKVERI